MQLDPYFDHLLARRHAAKPWTTFVDEGNRERAHDTAIDLLSKLLVYDHHERLTVAETMMHPYFDPVRPDNWDPAQVWGTGS